MAGPSPFCDHQSQRMDEHYNRNGLDE